MPDDVDILSVALGAPARRVLERAEAIGPKTGWKDGFLSSKRGFLPMTASGAATALLMCPGRIWSDICSRLPGIVARGQVRPAILEIPLVIGTKDVIPDDALWGAVVCLGILCSIWRYEERYDGRDGITLNTQNTSGSLDPSAFDLTDEEPETKGIPKNIAIPFRQICLRLGRPLPHLTQFDMSMFNYKLKDDTAIDPYPERSENMVVRWSAFHDDAERLFLMAMCEVHGVFIPGVEIVTRCQEHVMNRNNSGLLAELVKLKQLIDMLSPVFHKISVNPNAGNQFADPVVWGQRYARFSAPLSSRVPALSGLALPLFLTMDAFLGRTKYLSFLGREAMHLRAWLPLNVRAFIAAIETYYSVPEYVRKTGDPTLLGVLEGIVESYAGERGFMGTHRYKVYGFIEVVAKTGRLETNGNAGASDSTGRPWEEVHKTLSDSLVERLEPYRPRLNVAPHEMRGSFEECRFIGRIAMRTRIDEDPELTTRMISIDVRDTGITFAPGDRLSIMPLNQWSTIETLIEAIPGLYDALDAFVPLEFDKESMSKYGSVWKRFGAYVGEITRDPSRARLTIREILRRGRLQPLSRPVIEAVNARLNGKSAYVTYLLKSGAEEIDAHLGDLFASISEELTPTVVANTFPTTFAGTGLRWLLDIVPPEVPRMYSISCSGMDDALPSYIDLTVSRVNHPLVRSLAFNGENIGLLNTRWGVSSGFLNPHPTLEGLEGNPMVIADDAEEVFIGVSRPLHFSLPTSPAATIVMFAGGSGIAPFRGFLQERVHSGATGRNLLFFGVQTRQKLLYGSELFDYVKNGQLELFTAFSRDKIGLRFDRKQRRIVEVEKEPQYIDEVIEQEAASICAAIMPVRLGGSGAFLYVCGSVPLYESVMRGLRQALAHRATYLTESADEIIAMAVAERRFQIDIFMTPSPPPSNAPIILPSTLALHTGDAEGVMTWIGVHGWCYDVTDFLPIHPGGSLIVQASAGIDASLTFDAVAHTSNPEIMSLLAKYRVGRLACTPGVFKRDHHGGAVPRSMCDVYEAWSDFLRNIVETITTLSFELNALLDKNSRFWKSDGAGMVNVAGIRKFYQLQSRMLTRGFPSLLGTRLNDLHLKLSFCFVTMDDQGTDALIPDIVGMANKALSSAAAARTRKEIARLGELVSDTNMDHSVQLFERGVFEYVEKGTLLDMQLLKAIRAQICAGIEDLFAFGEHVKGVAASRAPIESVGMGVHNSAVNLLRSLFERLEGAMNALQLFFSESSRLTAFRPEIERNPARGRWRLLRRVVLDGTFMLYMDRAANGKNALEGGVRKAPLKEASSSVVSSLRSIQRQSVRFDQVLYQSMKDLEKMKSIVPKEYPEGLSVRSDPRMHAPDPSKVAQQQSNVASTALKSDDISAFTVWEESQQRQMMNHVEGWLGNNLKALRRISRVPIQAQQAQYGQQYQQPAVSFPNLLTRSVAPPGPQPPTVQSALQPPAPRGILRAQSGNIPSQEATRNLVFRRPIQQGTVYGTIVRDSIRGDSFGFHEADSQSVRSQNSNQSLNGGSVSGAREMPSMNTGLPKAYNSLPRSSTSVGDRGVGTDEIWERESVGSRVTIIHRNVQRQRPTAM
ncbi:hypothetical protein BJ742DRAFT_880965 [Cladochytrium replicatum]|nr:hypothetical protein BJ742DRAFT_880965 [Cladochytrium replicatum]